MANTRLIFMSLNNNFSFFLPIVGLGLFATYSMVIARKRCYRQYRSSEIINGFTNVPDELKYSLVCMLNFAKKHHPDAPDFMVYAKNIYEARVFFLQKLEAYFALSDSYHSNYKKISWLNSILVKTGFLVIFHKIRCAYHAESKTNVKSVRSGSMVATFASRKNNRWALFNDIEPKDFAVGKKKVRFSGENFCHDKTRSIQKANGLDLAACTYIKIRSSMPTKSNGCNYMISFVNDTAYSFVGYVKNQIDAGAITDDCKIIIGADSDIKYILSQSIRSRMRLEHMQNKVVCSMDEYDEGFDIKDAASFFNQAYLQLKSAAEVR